MLRTIFPLWMRKCDKNFKKWTHFHKIQPVLKYQNLIKSKAFIFEYTIIYPSTCNWTILFYIRRQPIRKCNMVHCLCTMVHCQCTMVHRQCTMVLFLMGMSVFDRSDSVVFSRLHLILNNNSNGVQQNLLLWHQDNQTISLCQPAHKYQWVWCIFFFKKYTFFL